MGIGNFDIDYTLNYDSEINVVSGYGEISSFLNVDADDPEIIGHFSFHYYNTNYFDEKFHLVVSADAISGDEEYLMSSLYFAGFDFEGIGKLVTFDGVSLDKNYYTKELEQDILEEFIDFCVYMEYDYIAVIASKPVANRANSNKVVEFPQTKMYEKYKFEIFDGKDKRNPIMIKEL